MKKNLLNLPTLNSIDLETNGIKKKPTTYRKDLMFFFMLCFASIGYAQVTVTGAVTGNGDYSTLGAAFVAINAGTQTNATIAISITGDTNESTTSASLGAGTWTSLTIKPVGPRTITGATTAGSALINLNGADNVTIDGLNTGGNSLTLTNTTAAATAGTSTIRFIADATNNTVTNCTIQGSSNLVASGTVFFSTGTTTGNDGNTISNCAITPAGSNLPVNAIYSAGTSTTIDNSGNTINNNTIQDYFSPTLSSAGILVNSFSSAWTISNNKLFQTATRTVTTAALTIRGIAVITASAGGYTISNNTIGFANASGTGTTTYDGAFTTVYRGIELTADTTTSSVQSNTIAGINFTTANTLATGLGVFSGIAVNSGAVNIGTSTANTIGSGTTASSIVINNTTVSAIRINGIYVSSASATSDIQNNVIGGFSSGTGASLSYNFIGIATAGASGNFTISNNAIGSTSLANSIVMGDANTTSGVCTINGINNAATLGTIAINSNTIANTTVFGTATSTFTGIVNGAGTTVTINSNTVDKVSSRGTGAVVGISNTIASSILQMNANTIRNFTVNNSTAAFAGIANSGVVTTSIAIEGNKLGDATSGLVTYSVANSGTLLGVANTAATALASLSIQNNDIRGVVHAVAGTSTHIYIYNTAATLSQNISGNTFTNLTVNTTGNANFISNNVALPANGMQTVNNNRIVTGYNKTGAGATVTVFITTATSNATGTTITNTGNNFSNITVTGATAIVGWNQQDLGSTTKTITNNTFSGWTGGASTITAMTINGFGNTSTVSGNNISAITGQGNITGLTIGSTGTATNLNVNNNAITGLASTGTGGSVTGLTSANNATAVNIFANPINNLSSTGASSTLTGISVTGGTGTISVYANTLNAIAGTGTLSAIAQALAISGGTTVNIYKNKVYDIAENGISSFTIVNAFNITGGTNVTCYNNVIGELKAPNTSNTSAVRGIFINSSTANSTYKLYYNSVYLNATSTGANFGTYGLYHATSAIATTANLILNNNVIINTSTAKGTGLTTAFYCLTAALNNYDLSSNNNLFYAGVPSATNVALYADTAYPTLIDLKGFVSPREQNSVTENTTFLSTTGSNANFLKPDATVPSFIESSGVNVAGFTTDYTDVTRQGNAGTTSTGTAPDLGAYEQNGIAASVNTAVTVSGAVVGNGNYGTLTEAFYAINQGAQTSATIAVTINENTNETAGSASLNAGAWSSLTVTPIGARTITGATLAGKPLIDLNGADNVTINGLNAGGNSLTISNTTVSARANTSTIRFIADATNNTITNCTIQGSSNLATSGTIFFSTGTTTGNDGNTISNCAITPTGSNLPVNAIYSAGSSTSIDNSGNTIDNNTIQDYFSPTISSTGINVAANSATWIITNNKLFQTATRTVTANSVTIRGIGIITASAGGYTISNNTIGFANAAGTGTTTYDGTFTTTYRGILLTANTTVSSLQDNTVAGINFTTASTANSGLGVFTGIAVTDGAVSVGTTTGNTIGSSNVASSIIINNTTTASIRINGINVLTAANTVSTVQNNVIGGFSTGTGATFGYYFVGIVTAGSSNASFTVSNNFIGSSTISNSIAMGDINTTSGVCAVDGIRNGATGVIDMNNNTISNIAAFGTAASTILGIYNGAGSPLTINSNVINNASNSGTGASFGINLAGNAAAIQVNNNTIRNFIMNNPTAAFTGIVNSGAVTTSIAIENNKLGDATGGLVTYTVVNSGALRSISNTNGASTASLSIQNNDIRGIVHSLAGSSSAHTYIINSAATLSQNISGNTFTNLNVNTNGGIIFIQNSVALPAGGTQTVNNNKIVGNFTNTGTTGSVSIFRSFPTSNASATVTNTGNNFSNINVTGSTGVTGWAQGDLGGCTKKVSNNVFRNWTVGSGIATGMFIEDNGVNKTEVFNNTIDNIIAPDGIQGGIVLGISGAVSCYGNNITNLSATRTDITVRLEGIRLLGRAVISTEPNKIHNNTVSGLFNAGGIGDNRTVGIGNVGGTLDYVFDIYNNTISNISTSGTGNHLLIPLFLTACKTGNIYNNKIYNITSNGVASPTLPTVTGISVATNPGGTWNIYNNLISDLRAPNTSSTNQGVVGVFMPDDDPLLPQSGFVNLYYNTINLNASSTGIDFGTAGVYHGNTGNVLDMRNNIISNTSTASGTGITSALLRSAAGTSYGTTYATTSNNNMFYAGVPSTSNVLLYDGTNSAQTLTNLQTALSPRESNTTSGAVTFMSATGTSTDFLRPNFANAATSSVVNNRGTTVAAITTDYEGTTRGSVPDIGAYEGCGVPTTKLTSTISTDAQIKCIGTAITDINYTTSNATGASFTNLPSGVNGSWTANSITISGTPAVTGIFNYSVILTNGCGTTTTSGSLEIKSTTWTGTTNNLWSVPTNWSCEIVPDGSQDILISSGTPILDINLTLQSGKTLTINGSGSLIVNPTQFLKINGSADFGGKSVVLKSDATGTASLGQVTGTITGATNVTVERYIPAKRAWRLLTAPLMGATNNSITTNWQGTTDEGLLLWSPATYQSQTMTGYTTGGTSPNIWKYNSGWQAIPNLTDETLYSATATKPFLVFATGPLNSTNILDTSGATETTLRPKGQLVIGTVTQTGLTTGTFQAIANPYASAISPSSLLNNNPAQKIWMLDPSLGTFGGYYTYDGTYWAPTIPSGNDINIQSGQGFFIRSATATSFTLREIDKVTGSSNTWFSRTANTTSDEETTDKIRVLLYKQIANEWQLADGILSVNYATGTNDVNEMDTYKISNFNESIMFRNNTTNLSIEHRALPQLGEMQPMRMTATTAVPYQLRVSTENYSNSTLQPLLEDTLAGTFTEIPVDGSTLTVPFTGIVSSSTTPDNRFRIVYQTTLGNGTQILTNIKVFPNPVINGKLNIYLGTDSSTASYTITNLLGQTMQTGTLENIQNVITVTASAQGIYILNINQEGMQYTTKILVK